ncbi:hypothetical protein ABIB48_001666 [Arthrobacter sp. UYCu511]
MPGSRQIAQRYTGPAGGWGHTCQVPGRSRSDIPGRQVGGATHARFPADRAAIYRAGRWGLGVVRVGEADVLGVQVFLDTFDAAFTAQTGLLDAAEGGCGVGDDTRV